MNFPVGEITEKGYSALYFRSRTLVTLVWFKGLIKSNSQFWYDPWAGLYKFLACWGR